MLGNSAKCSRLISIATGLLLFSACEADAHVKWFWAFDVAGQPRGLENILCTDFESLVALAVGGLSFGCLIEATSIGPNLLRALDRITLRPRADMETLIRAVCGAFFVALWAHGGILLTPELKTDSTFIPWLQLVIAGGMLSRSALGFSGVGIYYLFLQSLLQYGAFHLMDYPIFLGIGAYMILTGLQRSFFGQRPLDVMRASAAITLMWASIEKWAYPEWSFPLFISHPTMTMGYDQEYFMRAAGMIEFVLAFALLWTPLVRRSAAAVLVGMFISAVVVFGKIDAIGHAPIVIALFAVVCDDFKIKAGRTEVVLAPFALASTLAVFFAMYYELHSIMFGTSIA